VNQPRPVPLKRGAALPFGRLSYAPRYIVGAIGLRRAFSSTWERQRNFADGIVKELRKNLFLPFP